MKFYYKGKLVRTSKTHVYTHAVINATTGNLIGCRSSEDGARSLISSEISAYQRGIENGQSKIKAMEQGKRMYYLKDGRHSCYYPISKDDSVENTMDWIKASERQIEYIKNNWIVVELEARQ